MTMKATIDPIAAHVVDVTACSGARVHDSLWAETVVSVAASQLSRVQTHVWLLWTRADIARRKAELAERRSKLAG